MSWQGRVEVVTAGANAAHFKPVGTAGSVWGSVQVARAEDARTWPLGMPMREYELGGDRNGGWYEHAGEPRAPNWQVGDVTDFSDYTPWWSATSLISAITHHGGR